MANHGRNDKASVKDWATCISAISGLRWQRTVDGMRHRILVSGCRGRGRLVRLIAAGLRAGQVRTLAKVASSSSPRLILPDGLEKTLSAPARSQLLDQARAARIANTHAVDALVIESSDTEPTRAEISVVAPTLVVRFHDLLETSPEQSTFSLQAERERRRSEKLSALSRATRLRISDDNVADISWDELSQFPYIESPETIATALAACANVGIARSVALRGMIEAQPGPGLATVHHVTRRDCAANPIVFINGFATYAGNASNRTWQLACDYFGRNRVRVAVVNCRTDHAARADQLGTACGKSKPVDHYVLVGNATERFAASAKRAGLQPQQLTDLGSASIEKICNTIEKRAYSSTMLLGLGSFQGAGCQLAQMFRESNSVRHANRPRVVDAPRVRAA